MIKSIYVGNLPFRMKREEIMELFEKFGEVYSAKMIIDRKTGRPCGYGFVEMDEENVEKAIEGMNGYECMGRNLVVNEAKPKERASPKAA